MSDYEYHGCVTGFSEADGVTIWQPSQSPCLVQRMDGAYTGRLMAVALLSSTAIAPPSIPDGSGLNNVPVTAIVPMEWLTVTIDSTTPNMTLQDAYFNFINKNAFQTVDNDGILNAINPISASSLSAYYDTQGNAKLELRFDLSHTSKYYIMLSNNYGYNADGSKNITKDLYPNYPDIQNVAYVDVDNGVATIGLFNNAGTYVSKGEPQDHITIEFLSSSEMYITLLDGTKSWVDARYSTLLLRAAPVTKGDGTIYPIQPINVTRL